jgi:hypothetical protein
MDYRTHSHSPDWLVELVSVTAEVDNARTLELMDGWIDKCQSGEDNSA